MNLLLSLVVPLLFANHDMGVFHKMFCSPAMIRWINGLRSSYSCTGTDCLKSLRSKRLEKLYFLPNSVYCAEVIRSCSTSRWESTGCDFQASMRHRRMRAKEDMAGDKSFTEGQNNQYQENIGEVYLWFCSLFK